MGTKRYGYHPKARKGYRTQHIAFGRDIGKYELKEEDF